MSLKASPILITGVNGFIGNALFLELTKNNYDVWGIYRKGWGKNKSFKIDLLNINEIYQIKEYFPFNFTLIHSASTANNSSFISNDNVRCSNVNITKNIIKVFKNQISCMIFLSSVAVYGEDGRNTPISTQEALYPSTDYGSSKVECEKIIINSGIKNYCILRLSPVFDEINMDDVRKRVFLPIFKSIKILIKPSPLHSLTNINTIHEIIENILELNVEKHIINVKDKQCYSQEEISKWFQGTQYVFPLIFFKPFYWVTYIMPYRIGYKLRCIFWKYFKNNIYI